MSLQSYKNEQCRICLSDGNLYIFGDEDLSADINEFGNINIAEYDDLPRFICNKCYKLLCSAKLFRETAQETEKKLNIIGLGISSKYELQNEYDDCDTQPDDSNEELEVIEADSDVSGTESPSVKPLNLQHIESDEEDLSTQVLEVDVESEDEKVDKEKDAFKVLVLEKEGKEYKVNKYECYICGDFFDTCAKFEDHYENQHDSRPLIKCTICSQTVSKEVYKDHIDKHRKKYKHIALKRYRKIECQICLKKVGKNYLKTHLKSKHGSDKEKTETMQQCPVCKKSVTVNYFKNHMSKLHGWANSDKPVEDDIFKSNKSTPCPVCDKEIKEHKLKDHLAKHGKAPKKYICDKCGKEFIHPSSFKTHTLTHGAELKHKCQYCPYRGLHAALLKIHLRTHTGNYAYKCTKCSAKFITKSNLNVHQKRHDKAMDFKCGECQKGFYTKRHLLKHYNTVHLGIRNYNCEICNKAFGHQNDLISHKKNVHKMLNSSKRIGRMPSYLKQDLH